MKKMKYFALAALTLALGACSDDYEFFGDSKRITIEAGFGTSSRVATNGLSSMFEADDAIGVYVWTGSTALPDVAAGYVANNVTNTFDGKNWTATPQMLWKDAETPHYFLSVYPQTDILTTTTYTLDPADQEKSDLLVATNFGADNGGIVPQSNPVPLAFGHVMAKLRVNIKFNDEFTTAPAVEQLTAVAQNKATIDWQTATATATGDATGVELPALSAAAQGYACSYESVMVPQGGFKSVVVVIGGETYTFTSTKEMQLKKGTITTLNLSVGLTSIQAEDISILDWTLGTSIDGYLNNIDAQLAAIQSSLGDLAAVDANLKALIDELTAIKADSLLAILQEKDTELDAQITALQAYTDSISAADKDWASTTFATLEKYTEMQTTIAALQALVASNKTEITAAYKQAITDAITASEASMMTWVNDTLAAGYYDIATMDGKLAALEASLAESDSTHTAQLAAQQEALTQAKTELTAAYEAAITAAIEDYNGTITLAIGDAISEAKTELQAQITTINEALTTIQADILALKNSITTIEGQITAIHTSLGDLAAVDSTLQVLIDELTAIKADSLLAVLQEKDSAFDAQLAALQAYTDSISTADKDWASTTFATLEKYTEMQTTISTLQALVESNQTEVTAAYTQAIADAIAASEASMMTWVNDTLAAGYYDIATMDGKLAALEASIADGDAALKTQLEAQQTALAEAKTALTAAYETAIATAIEECNGSIATVSADLAAAKADLQGKIDTINAALTAIKADIETLKNKVATIEGQIAGIHTSLEDLTKVDTELKDLIKALQDADEDYDGLITALQAKDTELEGQIAALQTYVNDTLAYYGTKDWANATFATLDQYTTMQASITGLQELVASNKTELAEAINTAVTNMEAAIATSETTMKAWVNKTLAEGYYDIAAMDGKLAALATSIADGDAALKAQIEAQQKALEEAKDDLTAAYEKAINDAIAEGGSITTAIADAVKAAQDTLEGQISAVAAEIETIKKDIADIKESINTINGQITSINTSLEDLTKVDTELKDLIKALQDADENYDELITALQEKDAELEDQITALQTYVDGVLAKYGTKDWANATFATLDQYTTMQASITALQELVASKTDLTEAINTAVTNMKAAIATSEASMQTWVNETLAEGYYDIAAMDGKLAALKASIADGDAALKAQIEAQQTALAEAKTALTAAYEAAIATAIEEYKGSIATVSADLTAAKTELQGKLDEISGKITTIENRLKALENKLEARIQSIRFLPEYNDGKVMIEPEMTSVDLTFIVSPIAAADIAKEKVTAFIYHTQSRAVESPLELNVDKVRGDATTGMLTVTVTPPAEDYWATSKTANIYIQIDDDNNDIISEMIPAFYYAEPPYVTFSATEEQTFSWATPIHEQPMSLSTRASRTTTTGTFEYSVGGDDWAALDENQSVTFGGKGRDLRLRGMAPEGTNEKVIAFGNNNTPVACSGDIRMLINYQEYETTSTESAIFFGLFLQCEALSNASGLKLITNNDQMADYCYLYMFAGCTNLMEAPALPATTLATSCYQYMFTSCTKLTEAPALPATTLAEDCYASMFAGCTNLTAAPALPATTLKEYCYAQMFAGCTNLTAAPALPATTLAKSCYANMFNSCTGLTEAPALPATTLATSCYSLMFLGCANLNSVTMLATDISAEGCLYKWLSEVADQGTFTRAEGMESIPTGDSGIPSGWTVNNYEATGN